MRSRFRWLTSCLPNGLSLPRLSVCCWRSGICCSRYSLLLRVTMFHSHHQVSSDGRSSPQYVGERQPEAEMQMKTDWNVYTFERASLDVLCMQGPTLVSVCDMWHLSPSCSLSNPALMFYMRFLSLEVAICLLWLSIGKCFHFGGLKKRAKEACNKFTQSIPI